MIVFSGNPNIITPDFLMSKHISLVRGFNLSSPLNYYTPLRALLGVQENLPDARTENFDKMYISYIANNEEARIELLSIVDIAYLGGISLVLVDDSTEFRALINEALARVISTLYGYPVVYADEPEDLYDAPESDFSIVGLLTFDRDRVLLVNHMLEESYDEQQRIMG